MTSFGQKVAICIGLMVSLILAFWGVREPAYAGLDPRREVEMGREAAALIEKENKLVTDPQILDRVNKIGQEIAQIANTHHVAATYGSSEIHQFDYRFKVIESEDVNAFSLPGGFVYINTGLINYARSDHELAAVLAHEVAHAAHHHMVYLLKEQSKMDGHIAILLLASMLGKMDASNLGNLLVGAQLVKIARVSGYGQKAELDADRTAIQYLVASGYDPTGCVTFLERLARDCTMQPQTPLGIMQTHPPSRLRVRNAIEEIRALGLSLNRRSVTDSLKAVIEPAVVNGLAVSRIKLDDSVVFEPAPIEGVITSEARAQAIASRINQLLDAMPQLHEIRLGADNKSVVARGEQIIIVTNEDCSLHGKSAEELAGNAARALRKAVWHDFITSIY